MIGIFIGIFLLIGGLSMAFLSSLAAAMADRETTFWESTGTPLCFVAVAVIGIGLIVWGAWR